MLEASGWTPESFSIVVPVFNEEENTEIYELGVDHEFLYLVSPESASLADRIRDLQRKDPERARVSQVGYSAGGAAVLSTGIEECEGEILSALPPCFEVELSVIRRKVLQEAPVYGDFHRYLPVLAECAGFAVREVPADKPSRPESCGST